MDDGADVVAAVRRVTIAGMVVNVAVAVLKAVAGWMYASQALIADAVHSASDLVTDFAMLLGVRHWMAPPDERHPYGHGKIEALVTVFIALALALVAWELGSKAAGSIGADRRVAPPGLAAAVVALVSVAVKEAMFRWTRRVARCVRSPALESNAWHHRSDALSSVPVAVAVVAAWLFPSCTWADAAGALVVGVFILNVAVRLAWPALQELMDANMDDKAAAVEAVAQRVPGVTGVHKVRVRRYGRAYQADLHIQVDAAQTVAAGHGIGHAVKEAVTGAGIDVEDVVVHVEPFLHETKEG